MWLFNTLVILSVFGAIYCEEAEVKTEDGVLILTTDNFQSVIKENEYVLVEFCKYFLSKYCRFVGENSSSFYVFNVIMSCVLVVC